MKRPLGIGEAFALSVAVHAAILLLLLIHLTASAAEPPRRPPPQPIAFRFVDQPDSPEPSRPPREEAPMSDRDRVAESPEAAPDQTEQVQPRSEGAVAELRAPTRPTPTRPQRRPQPRPEPPQPEIPEPEPRPRPDTPGPQPEPREEPPTAEEKRRSIMERLAKLETGDLKEPPLDNPEGEFFGEPSSDIAFETQAVDWGPYAARLHRIVKRNWIIPPAAQIGTKGIVRVHFDIGTDGSIQNLEIVDQSGTTSLDDAAWAAILNSHPLPPPPLPEDWHKDTVGVRWTFYYNTRAR